MTITRQEFLLRARLDHDTLEMWIAEEWIIPTASDAEASFTDADVARAHLIRDLTEDLEVNNAGVGVILNLVDQAHGLRKMLAELLEAMRRSPDQRRPDPRVAHQLSEAQLYRSARISDRCARARRLRAHLDQPAPRTPAVALEGGAPSHNRESGGLSAGRAHQFGGSASGTSCASLASANTSSPS
jgi:chaperone modulatory protein CbpM